MMSPRLRALFVVLAASTPSACGPNVDVDPGGGGSATTSTASTSGGSGGSGTTTTTSGVTTTTSGAGGDACGLGNGDACVATAQCAAPDVQCVCLDGGWHCMSTQTGKPIDVSLPDATPTTCTACNVEGLHCGGYEPCGPMCHCTGGMWWCDEAPACPPFACPAEVWTLAQTTCHGLIGTVCEASGSCSPTCTCDIDPETGTPTWRCLTPPC